MNIDYLLDEMEHKRERVRESYLGGSMFTKEFPVSFKPQKKSPERKVNNLLPVAKYPIHKA